MSAQATTGVRAPRVQLPPTDAQTLGWIAVGASLALAVLGGVGHAPLLLFAGASATAALVAILAPQLILALLLFAGVAKATPWLDAMPIDLTIVTAGGVLLAMARRVLTPPGLPALPAATAFAAGLAALVVLSVLWSPGAQIGLERALRFETLTLTAFAAPLVLIRSRDELRRLMIGLIALAVVVALTAVSTGHASEPLVSAGGNEIELALFSGVGLFAAVYLVMVDRAWRRPVWLALPVAVFIPTILAAGSRGVLTGSALGLLALAGFVLARSRRKEVAIASILAAIVLLAFAAPQLAGQAGDKYARILSGGGEPLGTRHRLFAYGLDLTLAHPMGLGVGGYPAKTGIQYPHNVLLEVASELGIIGLALLVALILAAARSTLRGRAGPAGPEAIAAATFLALAVTESMFSDTYTLNRVFWFALGLALAVPRILARDHGISPRSS